MSASSINGGDERVAKRLRADVLGDPAARDPADRSAAACVLSPDEAQSRNVIRLKARLLLDRRLGRGVVGGSITRGVARDFQFCTARLVVLRSGSGATFVGAVTCAANWKAPTRS